MNFSEVASAASVSSSETGKNFSGLKFDEFHKYGEGHMLTDVADKGQLPHLFESAESLQFLGHVFEAIEELRVRRVTDRENEDKINNLVQEKYLLEVNWENAKAKVKSTEEEMELKFLDLRKGYELRLDDSNELLARQRVALDTAEKEMKTLRQEIRNLQFSKHFLEKQIRDQERKIQQQSSTMEKSFKQLAELDDHFQGVSQKVSILQDEQANLTSNVRDAIKFNKNLSEMIRHQRVALQENREEIGRLQSKMLKANTELQKNSFRENSLKNYMDETVVSLKLDLKTQKEAVNALTEKLNTAENDYRKSFAMLKESHELILHHRTTNNKLTLDNSGLAKSLSDKEENYTKLQRLHDETILLLTARQKEHESALQELTAKNEVLESQLKSALANCEALTKVKEQLEEINSQCGKKNLELLEVISDSKKTSSKTDKASSTDNFSTSAPSPTGEDGKQSGGTPALTPA